MRASPLVGRWTETVNPARAREIAATLLAGRPSLNGARVALLVEPGTEFIAAFFGTLLAGGCAVVLSPLHAASESAYFCEDSGAVALLVSRAWEGKSPRLPPGIARHVIEEIPSGIALADPPVPSPSAPSLQLYTSGTTGKPKGAVLTHANLAIQQELLAEAWGLAPSDTLLHVLPLHHMHGLCIALLSALGAGARVHFIAPFEAAAVWEGMGSSTVFMAVPTIYSKLLTAFDAAPVAAQERWRRHARALRLATSGSAALPVGLAERWRELTGRIPLERFGMTELGVALSNPLEGERRAGSVGLPLRTVRARVVDESGAPADTGELWIAGPSVFAGYHGRPDATAAAFVEADGIRWFRTGDTVARETDGYFRILGRTSVDILKSGGYKLSALEIEEALREHPMVGEVAVIGLPDEVWGERVVACVVPRPGQSASEENLRAFAKERMASYKVPKQIVFLTELPRNALGKVIKPELVQKLQS